jgi:hypothetical protein
LIVDRLPGSAPLDPPGKESQLAGGIVVGFALRLVVNEYADQADSDLVGSMLWHVDSPVLNLGSVAVGL